MPPAAAVWGIEIVDEPVPLPEAATDPVADPLATLPLEAPAGFELARLDIAKEK